MPWSGSAPNQTFIRSTGTQTGPTAWQLEDAAGTRVVAAKFDTHDQDIADGLSAALKRDGGNKPSANIPMAGFRFTGVGDAAATDDFFAAGQAGKGSHDWYGNTSGTDTYTLGAMTFAPAAYTNGQVIRCRFTNANTVTTPTLNQDSKGAKTIVRSDGTALAVGEITSGMVGTLIYGSTADKLFLQSSSAGVRENTNNTFAGTNTFNETVTLNDDIVTPVVTLTDAAAIAWDMSTGSVFKVTLGGNRTLDVPTGETEGQRGELYVIQDGTGSRTLTFDASYGTVQRPDPTANATTKYSYYVRGANDVILKKEWSSAAGKIGFYREYDLGGYAVSTNFTQSHGLSTYPSHFEAWIECTSNEHGYAVGGRIQLNSADRVSISSNTSTITIRTSSNAYAVVVSAFSIGSITPANWKIILRVYE